MNKAFTSLLLASTTTLAACGGGGGGGGGNDYTPIQVTNLGSVNTAAISNGFAAAIQTVSQDGLVDAKETLSIFEWVDANADINTTELAKYDVTVNGNTMNLQEAWYMLKGYKALYYDGKESFWNDMITNGEFDDASADYVELKAIADNDDPSYAQAIGQGGKTVEDFKTDKGVITLASTVTETITLTSDPVVGDPEHVSTTYTDANVDTVLADGRTQHDVVRTNTHTTRTPSTVTVTTYTLYTYTYSDGSTKNAKGAESYANNTTYTTAITTEEVIISTTYTAASSDTDESSDTTEDTTEETPETITVVNTDVSYSNKTWSHVEKTFGEPVVTTEDVVTMEGTYEVTTRITTTSTPEYHEHFDKQTKTTVITYSDDTTETTTEEVLTSRGKVAKGNTTTTASVEIARVQTDNGVIGEDHADMGTRTPGYVADASHYRTDEFEYLGSKHLSVSNFDVAYSRGWTGKGSTIVIADTGANILHEDLDGNVKHTKDFTGNGINNSATHGTHVAGIAGAEKNTIGGHGAAFDADLAIAKVSGGSSYSFQNATKAAEWGQTIGSVAINVSAEVNYDSGFRNSIVKEADGVYYSTHWYYGENGYNGSVGEAKKWKSALGNEQVLVKAAGNAGWDYSAGMNQMATATDTNGNLILDGQMIIVGNWDENNKQINSSSNKAGTVCATMQNGVCIDAAKIKDFYIMANGTAITSTATNGGYTTMTGTSMAAPVVTGSIAVLHQMWPHMKGKHLVQLVLVTGNKNIVGYDENVHGQGLLDMDRATRPVGATGIPTTGRTNGGVSSVAGGANVQGVAASEIQALTSVMVLDSFERDFYIDLGDMTQTVDTRTASVAEQMGAVNYFAGYMNTDQHAAVPFKVTENSNLEVGFGRSDAQYLGNSFSGTLGTTTDSNTVYANYNYRNGGFFAQAGIGYTSVNFDMNNSMMVDAENVISTTATAGYEFAPTEGHTLGFAVSQPVTVESAKFTYNVPTSRTLDGNVNTELRTVDFKNSNREIDLGTYYNFDITKTGIKQVDSAINNLGLQGDIRTFAEIRTGIEDVEKRGGVNLNLRF
jgi:subtilisin family serine protease